MANKRSALLLGATGLVGHELLQLLLADETYGRVVALVRRTLPVTHAKLTQHVVDFDQLGQSASLFAVEDVFCCLGTTIKKAGSPEAFRKVDFTYPYQAAQLALQQGTRQFLLVTALGANPQSTIFYSRVKGEVEAQIGSLGLPAFHVFRPSLLLGDRQEARLGEQIAQPLARLLGFLLVGGLRKYRAIPGKTVAQAMLAVAKQNIAGHRVFESDQLQQLGKSA